MNRFLHKSRLPLFCCFCVVSALTLTLYVLPWRFVIPGYRFPYHGMPSLIIGIIALGLGIFGAIRNWGLPTVNWPWGAAILLISVQAALLFAFLQGPEIAIGRGTAVAPWGRTPIEMPFDIKPLWAAYAAFSGSLVSLVIAVLSLFANRIVAEQTDSSKSPVGRESES